MFKTFKEAFDAFASLADDESDHGQAAYESAELYLLTTPPRSIDDAILALRCIRSNMAGGGRTDALDQHQCGRIETLMANLAA